MINRKTIGADLLAAALSESGTKQLFTLSGNQIMSIFDASIDNDLELFHVRHEAAAVHMADAWGRLTEKPGIALTTAGPGFANTISALYVAKMAESPMVLLAGHSESNLLGQGAFQEMPQAEMASHVTKASWTVMDPQDLVSSIHRAMDIANSGRPGPVQISLPANVLEAPTERQDSSSDPDNNHLSLKKPANTQIINQFLEALNLAKSPLVITGPAMVRNQTAETALTFAQETQIPVIGMESPRGINDPSLGAFAEVLPEADLILLLGKKLDFSLRFGNPEIINPKCTLLQVDSDQSVIDQTLQNVPKSQLITTLLEDPRETLKNMLKLARNRKWKTNSWYQNVLQAVEYRPEEWNHLDSSDNGLPHPVGICRLVQQSLDQDHNSILISDGGEYGQWVQACISPKTRIINGTAGSIGTAIPYALAARVAFPKSTIITMLGDGTFGFHASEFDTAVRHKLPFVAVVGNDATWNAEYQIQLRSYGENRLTGCELLETRYDEVAMGFGAHGEYVERISEFGPAMERALGAGMPACVNVAIQRNQAPIIRRTT